MTTLRERLMSEVWILVMMLASFIGAVYPFFLFEFWYVIKNLLPIIGLFVMVMVFGLLCLFLRDERKEKKE